MHLSQTSLAVAQGPLCGVSAPLTPWLNFINRRLEPLLNFWGITAPRTLCLQGRHHCWVSTSGLQDCGGQDCIILPNFEDLYARIRLKLPSVTRNTFFYYLKTSTCNLNFNLLRPPLLAHPKMKSVNTVFTHSHVIANP